MAEVKHFLDKDSIQQDADFLKGILDGILKQLTVINNTKVQLQGSKSMGAATDQVKQLQAESQKLVDLQLKIAKAETEYAKARLNSNKADTEAVKTKKQLLDLEVKVAKEKERLIALAEKEAKEIEKANNEYIKLNTRYKEASAASLKRGAELLKEANGNDALFQSLLRTDKEYLAATKSAATYNQQLLTLEQNVGRSQRNVGNYASAFSGLNNSFAQIGRELPSLAINFQTFALAISNNLPIAIDEISKARVEIAKLKAEGQAAPSLFKQITGAVLSFQVGISILIAAFTLLAPKIADFVSNLFGASTALDQATARINTFAASAESSAGDLARLNTELDQYISLLTETNSVMAGGDLDTLRAQLQISWQKETQAVKTANEAWQSYLGIGKEITKLSVGKDFFGSVVDKEVPEDLKKQQAEVLKIYQEANKQVQEEGFNQQLIGIRINNQKIRNEKELAEKLKQEAEKLAEFRKRLAEDEIAAQRALILLRLQNEADAQQRIAESDKFTLDERLNALTKAEEIREAILKQQQDDEIAAIRQKAKEAGTSEASVQNQIQLVREQFAIKNLDLTRETNEKRLDLIKQNLDEEEKLQLEAFQKRIKAIENAGAIEASQIQKQRDEELLALSERANATALTFEEQQKERLKILAKYAKLELEAQLRKVEELIKLETDPVKRAALEAQSAALRLKIDDESTEEKIKNLKEVQAEEKKLADLQKQLQQEVFTLIKTFTLGRFDVAKNQIQDQIDKTEEQKRKEIDAINATTLPAIEKQARITNAEKKAQAERERLELRQRQLDRQRAQFERAFTIAQIIAKTAEAIIEAVALSPATGGLPFSAIAAAIGAVQIATVLAQPIPKFKEGKGQYDKYEGSAWVGDGGKSEMIFRESGEVEKTPSTPVLTWVGKNDIIHPDADALLNHTIKKQGEVMNYSVPGDYAFDEMTSTLKNGFNQLNKTVQNKREYYFNINNGKPSIMTKDGSRIKTYLNDNLQFGK